MNERFLNEMKEEILKTLENRWYELKGKKMQQSISLDEKNEIRRIESKCKE